MKTKEIPQKEWPGFCDSLSRQHEGSLATLEVFGAEFGAQVEERGLPFEGIVAEWNEVHGNRIAIMVGGKWDHHLTHNISQPTHVIMEQINEGADATLAIMSEDGVTALLRFRSPMLPAMPGQVTVESSRPSL
jgi:hypothetical protein